VLLLSPWGQEQHYFNPTSFQQAYKDRTCEKALETTFPSYVRCNRLKVLSCPFSEAPLVRDSMPVILAILRSQEVTPQRSAFERTEAVSAPGKLAARLPLLEGCGEASGTISGPAGRVP
jgi:hypothetical protein